MEGTWDTSDSDSGESWTLLDTTPSYADEAPTFYENQNVLNKDDDTDEISIISEPEIPSTFDHLDTETENVAEVNSTVQNDSLSMNSQSTKTLSSDEITGKPLPVSKTSLKMMHNNDYDESMEFDKDYLIDGTRKLRTYVHKRNNKLSAALNILLFSSVVTAAGIALGHIWAVKEECPQVTTPSINKILSNLYKLQEENDLLRSKLRELSIVNSLNYKQKKIDSKRIIKPKDSCKKIFEAPLNSDNVSTNTKCVEDYSVQKVLDEQIYTENVMDENISYTEKISPIYSSNMEVKNSNLPYKTKTPVMFESLTKVTSANTEQTEKKTNINKTEYAKDINANTKGINKKKHFKTNNEETQIDNKNPKKLIKNEDGPLKKNTNTDHIASSHNKKDSHNIVSASRIPQAEKLNRKTRKSPKYNEAIETNVISWYEKRAKFRNEARNKKFEGFNKKKVNNAQWYFRRMNTREQTRGKLEKKNGNEKSRQKP